MFKQGEQKSKKALFLTLLVAVAAMNYCFKHALNEQDWLQWTNRCLLESYDASADAKLKKREFTITPDAFIRLRKTYSRGKQEYFSFNLHQLNDINYLGSDNGGTLQFKTNADDIIVQTRNDARGDVDSMTTVLNVPVKGISAERLDSLNEALNYFKTKGL